MAKSDKPRALVDSSALIAWIKGDPVSARIAGLLEMIDRGDAQLVASVVTLAEVYRRSTAEDIAQRLCQDQKMDALRANLESPDVMLVDVTAPVARRATEYRLTYKMRLPDAVHLATAVLNSCDWFVTLDSDFPDQVDGLRVFRAELLDDHAQLPWKIPVQEALFTASDNVEAPTTADELVE